MLHRLSLIHISGSMAFKEAMQKANPVLLEPIMKVEVTMPEEYMGDVIGDINSRRGRIEGMEDISGGKTVSYTHLTLNTALVQRMILITLVTDVSERSANCYRTSSESVFPEWKELSGKECPHRT